MLVGLSVGWLVGLLIEQIELMKPMKLLELRKVIRGFGKGHRRFKEGHRSIREGHRCIREVHLIKLIN